MSWSRCRPPAAPRGGGGLQRGLGTRKPGFESPLLTGSLGQLFNLSVSVSSSVSNSNNNLPPKVSIRIKCIKIGRVLEESLAGSECQ